MIKYLVVYIYNNKYRTRMCEEAKDVLEFINRPMLINKILPDNYLNSNWYQYITDNSFLILFDMKPISLENVKVNSLLQV